MKANTLLGIIVVVIVLIGGYALMNRPKTTEPSATTNAPGETILNNTSQSSQPVSTMNGLPATVRLAEQNELGQSGTATFKENADGKLVVTLALSGGSFTTPQPAHIHLGTCPEPGAIKYPLTNVVNGKSETVLNATWTELLTGGESLAVNVHKSAAEAKVYTACGDLPVTASTDSTGTGGY